MLDKYLKLIDNYHVLVDKDFRQVAMDINHINMALGG